MTLKITCKRCGDQLTTDTVESMIDWDKKHDAVCTAAAPPPDQDES